jgi:hypothetical protein
MKQANQILTPHKPERAFILYLDTKAPGLLNKSSIFDILSIRIFTGGVIMKIFSKICFLVLVVGFSGKLTAQETAQPSSDLQPCYDRDLFQWSYSMFSGLTLNFQNQSSVTMYGIKESMKKALAQYEDANQQYRSYRNKTIAGNILVWTGFAAAISGAFVPICWDSNDNAYDNNSRIGIGVALGGLVTEIIGAFVLQSGQENIFDAVNLYNRHKIDSYK